MANIRLNKQDKTIKIVNRKDNLRLTRTLLNLNLHHSGRVGPQGEQGVQGDRGAGIPAGGVDGQFLAKEGSADYEYQWITPSFTGDKYATAVFSVVSEVAFTHNLNKYPAVTIIDSAGDEVVGSTEYVDSNSVIARFNAPFSGRITCN